MLCDVCTKKVVVSKKSKTGKTHVGSGGTVLSTDAGIDLYMYD